MHSLALILIITAGVSLCILPAIVSLIRSWKTRDKHEARPRDIDAEAWSFDRDLKLDAGDDWVLG